MKPRQPGLFDTRSPAPPTVTPASNEPMKRVSGRVSPIAPIARKPVVRLYRDLVIDGKLTMEGFARTLARDE